MLSLTQISRLANILPSETYVLHASISSFQQTIFQTSHSLLPHLSHGVLFPPLWNSLASWGHSASIYLSTVSWMLCVWAPPMVSKLKIWRIPNPSKFPLGVTRKSLQAESQLVLTSTQYSLSSWEQAVLKQNKQNHNPTLLLNKLCKVSDWKKTLVISPALPWQFFCFCSSLDAAYGLFPAL